MLRVRQLIPPLTLGTSTGQTVHAWDLKQRKNLVIAFLDPASAECRSWLDELVRRADDLRAREAVALIVLPDAGFLAPKTMPQEIIAGLDLSGSAENFFGKNKASESGHETGVFVTDRYGELSAIWAPGGPPGDAHSLPTMDQVVRALDHIQIACEECYMPHWPVEG